MGALTQHNLILVGILIISLSISLFASTANLSEIVSAYTSLQQDQYVRVSDGLMDACLQSGYSYSYCENILYSKNPGGYCDYLTAANLGCPQIQDPAFTYSNPGAAMQESQQKSNQLGGLIQQWDYLYPPGWFK